MHPKQLKIEDYTYQLPDHRIAKYPLAERDASKLLIYDRHALSEDTYANIAAHIPEGSLMVFNQTKVVHARLLFRKSTGSNIEVFCLAPHSQYSDIQSAMQQKKSVLWECLVGGAAKWKDSVRLTMKVEPQAFTLSAKILERNPGSFSLKLEWDNDELTFAEVLQFAGKVPLPPYIHREADSEDEQRYQTLYAKHEGSVAAPTAGLHFTEAVMESLRSKHIDTSFVTLHVGAGTFKPVKSETMEEHDMHAEWIDVTRETISELLGAANRKVIAVGTTSLRTLESLYWIGNQLVNGKPLNLDGIAVAQWEPYSTAHICTNDQSLQAVLDYMRVRSMQRLITRTQILIAPGYTFRIVDGLVTNFHQPQSTLLLLVAAMIGEDWIKMYDHALQNKYRFLSYGDGCLIWK